MERSEALPVDGTGLSLGIVLSTFNEDITGGLLEGALAACEQMGIDSTVVVRVSGALEIPVVAKHLAAHHDAVVAIGAVIEGETDHYHHVATQTSAGIMLVSVETGVPVANAVLTVRSYDHARERSLPGPGNKGAEAVEAAVRAARAVARLR